MTNIDSKVLSLVKKVNELAKSGVGGEKQNAAERLTYLMKKYGVTPEMIEGDIKTEREFKVTQDQRTFFIQIVFNVCGKIDTFYRKSDKHNKYIRLYATVTDYEFIEISEKFYFYWGKYEADLVLFYKSFIHKNKLTTKLSDEERQSLEPSPEEIEEYFRIQKMMKGLDSYSIVKQIENK
jgi:hypothetical protein